MSRFGAIDLSQLPVPAVVERLDYETILAAMRAELVARAPQLAPVLVLESEPAVKILEVAAYREMLLRARINDAARAVMLATATGADLDNLAALLGVSRFVLDPGDLDAVPPVAATLEADADLRYRAQLALEGYTVAGPRGAYVFHAASASPLVRDVSVTSPAPGTVLVTILSAEADGIATPDLLAVVDGVLNAEEIRPLCDTVIVAAAEVLTYAVIASLELDEGPDPLVVQQEAFGEVAMLVEEGMRLGRPVSRSALMAALHRTGVRRVVLTSPAADVECSELQAARCTAITVTVAP